MPSVFDNWSLMLRVESLRETPLNAAKISDTPKMLDRFPASNPLPDLLLRPRKLFQTLLERMRVEV